MGEWQFRLMDNEPNRVIDEHWYMDPAHVERGMYRRIPRHNLYGENITADDFIAGPSEDWRLSAVRLNGRDQSFSVSDGVMRLDVEWDKGKTKNTTPADQRRSLDMTDNNFLIEILGAFTSNSGGICGKVKSNGYLLDLEQGKPRLQLFIQDQVMMSATCSQTINDAQWHHLIVEADRANSQIHFYLDGKMVSATSHGKMTAASISNHGDFLLGRDHQDHYAAISVDFLRVSQGTLADAETTIEELFVWQNQGPFLRSLFGTTLK